MTVIGGTLVTNVTENIEASRKGTHYYCLATKMIGHQENIVAAVRNPEIIVTYTCKLLSIVVS